MLLSLLSCFNLPVSVNSCFDVVGKEWLSGLGLSSSLADSDIALTHMLHKRLLETVHPSSAFNVTLRLDTSQVRGFLLTARASLVWPLVLSNYKSSFELTQVGNATFTDVTLRNPSDRDLWVHLVPLAAYPNGAKVANMLPSRYLSNLPSWADTFRSTLILQIC